MAPRAILTCLRPLKRPPARVYPGPYKNALPSGSLRDTLQATRLRFGALAHDSGFGRITQKQSPIRSHPAENLGASSSTPTLRLEPPSLAACGRERWRSLATQIHALPSHPFKGATGRAGTIVAPRPEVWTSNVRDRLAVLPVVRSSIVTVIR